MQRNTHAQIAREIVRERTAEGMGNANTRGAQNAEECEHDGNTNAEEREGMQKERRTRRNATVH